MLNATAKAAHRALPCDGRRKEWRRVWRAERCRANGRRLKRRQDRRTSASKRLLLPRATAKAARRAPPGERPTAREAARAALRALPTDGRRRKRWRERSAQGCRAHRALQTAVQPRRQGRRAKRCRVTRRRQERRRRRRAKRRQVNGRRQKAAASAERGAMTMNARCGKRRQRRRVERCRATADAKNGGECCAQSATELMADASNGDETGAQSA